MSRTSDLPPTIDWNLVYPFGGKMMSTVFLKVKIKSLAEEAKIIRREERLAINRGQFLVNDQLHVHRVMDVRSEARSALLAYAFLKRRPYRVVEQEGSKAPDFLRVERLAVKYGASTLGDASEIKVALGAWFKEGDVLKKAS